MLKKLLQSEDKKDTLQSSFSIIVSKKPQRDSWCYNPKIVTQDTICYNPKILTRISVNLQLEEAIVSSISSLESPSSGFSKLSRRQPEQESIIARQGALSSQFITGQESRSLCSANCHQEASTRFLVSSRSKKLMSL